MDGDASESVTPWANGSAAVVSIPPCRRTAVRALGCWIYCEHQRPTIWPEHHHEGQVQVLVNHLDFGMDIQAAGAAPRMRQRQPPACESVSSVTWWREWRA